MKFTESSVCYRIFSLFNILFFSLAAKLFIFRRKPNWFAMSKIRESKSKSHSQKNVKGSSSIEVRDVLGLSRVGLELECDMLAGSCIARTCCKLIGLMWWYNIKTCIVQKISLVTFSIRFSSPLQIRLTLKTLGIQASNEVARLVSKNIHQVEIIQKICLQNKKPY